MDTDNLVRMANRIGDFFAAQPDPVQARADVARHLQMYWDPRMRRALDEHVRVLEQAGMSSGLKPLVRQALDQPPQTANAADAPNAPDAASAANADRADTAAG
jgi:formate dehydrogenase subunit delta